MMQAQPSRGTGRSRFDSSMNSFAGARCFAGLAMAVALTACGLGHPPAVKPASSPRGELIGDVKAFEQTLGVGATGNFLRYSDSAGAIDRCYFTGRLELPVSYRALGLTGEGKEPCAARGMRYDVFFYPVEAVASGSAAITPALTGATVERMLVVVPHEDFHSQPEVRKAAPDFSRQASLRNRRSASCPSPFSGSTATRGCSCERRKSSTAITTG
jgi:hypothetical protein